MKWIYCVILMLCTGFAALAEEPVVLKEAFVVLKFGSVELEDKDGNKSKVEVKSESESSPAKVIRLTGGETIRTEKNSNCQVVIPEAGAIQLSGEGGIKIPAIAPEGQQKEKVPASIELLGGKLFLDIDAEKLSRDKKEFRVKTPTTILAVKGTRFYIETSKDSETTGVHKGRVLMLETQSGEQVTINTNKAATAKPGAITQPRAMTAEELALAKSYESLALEFVPAEGQNRKFTTKYTVGVSTSPDGLINVEKGEEYDGGTSLKIKVRPYPEAPDKKAFAVTNVQITKEPRSQPRAIYFAVRSQDIKRFMVRSGVEWKGRHFNTGIIQNFVFPTDAKPEQWVSFFVPLYEGGKSQSEGEVWIEVHPHEMKEKKPEFALEISPIMFAVDPKK